ncbi:MAG: TRAP transporter substrate-binding protein [Alphaproteobacteria bacterium]
MKRRSFLKGAALSGAAVTAAAASSFPAPAIAQGVRELKMVTSWPKRLPGPGVQAEVMAERITELTEGKVQVKVYAAGELVPAFEVFDAVRTGTADMGHSAAYYWQGKHKAFNFFTTVPYGLTSTEHYAWVYYGGGQALWDELGAQFNMKPFMRGSTGVQMGGWFRKEINSLEDMKGLKMRMPGLGGEVLRNIGVAAVNLPGGEIFPALQSGTIDATEWVGPWNDLAFGFYKVAKFYYWPGFHEPGTVGELTINLDTWNSLTKHQQQIISAVSEAQVAKEVAEWYVNNADSLPVLLNKHKVQLRQFPDEVMTEIGRVAGEVVAAVAAEDPFTTKVYDSFIDFRKKALGWTKYGEQAFVNARSLPFKYSKA